MASVNKNFISSIVKSNSSKELADKVGETALDAILDQGILRDIPIIGTAISLLKAGDDIKSYLFAKKILTFLAEVEQLPSEQRSKFLSDNFQTVEQQEKVTDNLLLQIEQAQSMRTCKLLGKVFSAYVSGKINHRYYQLFCNATMRMNDYLLDQLHMFYKSDTSFGIEFHAMNEVSSLGLLDLKVTNQLFKNSDGDKGFFSNEAIKNELGKSFYRHIVASEYA